MPDIGYCLSIANAVAKEDVIFNTHIICGFAIMVVCGSTHLEWPLT